MKNFNFYSPTYFAFGKDKENSVSDLVAKFGGSRVLIHYGGNSAIKSGLIDRVKKSFDEKGISYVVLGGVNPIHVVIWCTKEFRFVAVFISILC
jgi:alcohol dehydrogenase YqhD (iron-dependent ADH family)